MSGKMDWDRVRIENREKQHGSEHIDRRSQVLTSSGQLAPPTSRKKKSGRKGKDKFQSFSPIPGCTCGKLIGFKGEHKRRCPLAGKGITTIKATGKPAAMPSTIAEQSSTALQGSASSLSLSDLVIRFIRVRLDPDLKGFFLSLQRRLAVDRRSLPFDKEMASEIAKAVLTEIDKYQKGDRKWTGTT